MTVIEQISAAAANGLTAAEVVATVLGGRAMGDAERMAYSKARGIWKLREAKRKSDRAPGMSAAERNARHAAKYQDIAADLDKALAAVNWKRRKRAEGDLLYFLKAYCTSDDPSHGCFLEIPPAKGDMEEIVRDMEVAIGDSSVPWHVRVARGHGKTSIAKGGVLWTVATGRRRYVMAVAANDENADSIVNDVFACMTKSPEFVADFPEIAIPFVRLEGAYQRAKTQKYCGAPTSPQKSAGKITLPTIVDKRTSKPFPSSGAIIEAIGFNAGARGKVKGILRPDFILYDDLQNDDRAQSDGQVGKMATKIRKTFMGLGGHRKKIAAIMTSTPIEADDLSETFASDAGWRTRTYRMVKSWPKCHDLSKSADERRGVSDLWAEYFDVIDAETAADRNPHLAGNRFYRANRSEMDDGAEVLNPRNFDRATELSGVQHAMNILHRDGYEAFMSEYQMAPVRNAFAFALTAKTIMARVRPGVPACTCPDETVVTVAATDVNPSIGLSTVVVSYDVHLTGLVVAYKVMKTAIDSSLNETAFNAALAKALSAHAREVAALGIKIDRYGIDAGGRQFRAVTMFAKGCAALFGLEAVAMVGRASTVFNPNVKSRIRDAVNGTVVCRDERTGARWLAWDADVHKEAAQLAWGTEVGGDGGMSIFDGGVNHYKFAMQVAAEKLVSKSKMKVQYGGGEERYSYAWKLYGPNHLGDATAMCHALASSIGVSGDGGTTATNHHHKRRTYGE